MNKGANGNYKREIDIFDILVIKKKKDLTEICLRINNVCLVALAGRQL